MPTDIQHRPPGPGIWDFHTHVMKNPVVYFRKLMDSFGDVVYCKSAFDFYLISSPEHARTILQQNPKSLTKDDPINTYLRSIIGNGVVVSHGELWRNQRHRVQPIFNRSEVDQFIPLIRQQANALVLEWQKDRKKVVLQKEFERYVLKIILKCLFNEDREEIIRPLLKSFLGGNELVNRSSLIDLPTWFPFTRRNNAMKEVKNMDTVIEQLLTEHCQSNKFSNTIIDLITSVQVEDSLPHHKQQWVDEIKNVLVAGQFSTVDLLSWMVYSLASHSSSLIKIRNEVKHSNDPNAFKDAPYFSNFMHEVMRSYPPAWSSWHKTQQPINLGSYVIPSGKTIVISIYNIHHHSHYWEKPDEFNPDRFVDKFPQEAFMPYGIGQRKCLGMGLANHIICHTLAEIVSHFDLSTNPAVPQVEIHSKVTLGSRYPITVNLHTPYN